MVLLIIVFGMVYNFYNNNPVLKCRDKGFLAEFTIESLTVDEYNVVNLNLKKSSGEKVQVEVQYFYSGSSFDRISSYEYQSNVIFEKNSKLKVQEYVNSTTTESYFQVLSVVGKDIKDISKKDEKIILVKKD